MALAWFQSLDGNTTIQLDAVENITRSRIGTVTKSRVESGARVTDHYETEPITTSFSGVITNIKINDINVTPQPSRYVTLVDELMLAGTPFIFNISDDDLPRIRNALITDFTISRNARLNGGFKVDISIQEIDFVTAAQVTGENFSVDVADQNASTTQGGDGTTKEVNPTLLASGLSTVTGITIN